MNPPEPQAPTCLACGYDLRGLPAGACPECGLAFDPADQAREESAAARRAAWPWVGFPTLIAFALPLLTVHAYAVATALQYGAWPSGFDQGTTVMQLRAAAFFGLVWSLTAWLPSGILLFIVVVVQSIFGSGVLPKIGDAEQAASPPRLALAALGLTVGSVALLAFTLLDPFGVTRWIMHHP